MNSTDRNILVSREICTGGLRANTVDGIKLSLNRKVKDREAGESLQLS